MADLDMTNPVISADGNYDIHVIPGHTYLLGVTLIAAPGALTVRAVDEYDNILIIQDANGDLAFGVDGGTAEIKCPTRRLRLIMEGYDSGSIRITLTKVPE